MKVEPGEWADDAGAKGWAERLHRQNPQYRTIELWDRKRLVERCQRVPDTSQTAPKSDPLDADACRAQAGKLRADAAREQAPEQREVLLAMAKEYDTLADEMERLGK